MRARTSSVGISVVPFGQQSRNYNRKPASKREVPKQQEYRTPKAKSTGKAWKPEAEKHVYTAEEMAYCKKKLEMRDNMESCFEAFPNMFSKRSESDKQVWEAIDRGEGGMDYTKKDVDNLNAYLRSEPLPHPERVAEKEVESIYTPEELVYCLELFVFALVLDKKKKRGGLTKGQENFMMSMTARFNENGGRKGEKKDQRNFHAWLQTKPLPYPERVPGGSKLKSFMRRVKNGLGMIPIIIPF